MESEEGCIDLAQNKCHNSMQERVDTEKLNIILMEEGNEQPSQVENEDSQKGGFRIKIKVDWRKGKPLHWAALLGFVLVLCVPGAEAIDWPINETEQTLPQQCLSWLKYNGCPQRGSPFSHWNERNQECCGGYTGVFHCQEVDEEIDDKKYVIAACLQEQVVSAGKEVRLIQNETGYPKLDLTKGCSPGTFRKENMNSSFSRHQHCELKMIGDNTKEDKLCDGGTTNEDLYVCKEGYQSLCPHGRNNSNDLCLCFRLLCEKGTQPFRNITGQCIDSSIRVNYNCQTPVTPPSPMTLAIDTTTVASPPGSGQGVNVVAIVVGIVVVVLVALIVGIVFLRRCRRSRRGRRCRRRGRRCRRRDTSVAEDSPCYRFLHRPRGRPCGRSLMREGQMTDGSHQELFKKPIAGCFTEETKETTAGPFYLESYPAGSCSSETQLPADHDCTSLSGIDIDLTDSYTKPAEGIATELQAESTAELQTMASKHILTPGQDSEKAPDDSFSGSYEGDEYCESSCSFCSTSDSSSSASPHTDLEQSDSSDGDGGEDVSARPSVQGTEKHLLKDDTVPPLLFAKEWQTSAVFREEGGCLRPSHSDVVLHVPQGAVPDAAVEVRAAVCADVAHIRHVLGLSEEEEVVSPLAEFWAGEDYRFQRPVCVVLPHCLPAHPDPDRVQVYHVTRSQPRGVVVSRLTRQAGDGHGRDSDVTPAVGGVPDPVTLPGVPAQEQHVSPVHSALPADTERATPSEEVTHGLGTFRIGSDGVVTILTDTFCGYVCVYCPAKEKKTKPQLFVMGCVTDSSEKWVKISAHVWDGRLKIEDFRWKFKIKSGDSNPLNLLDNIANTMLYMRLRLPMSPSLRHYEDEHGEPIQPMCKAHNIPSLLSCKKCIRKGKIRPISSHWIVEPRDGQVPTSDEFLSVDISHVVADALPRWEHRSRLENATMVDVKVPGMNHRGGNTPTEQWKDQLQELNTAMLRHLAAKLGVPDGLPGDDHRPHAETNFRTELIQKILREGPTKIISALTRLLSQVSLSQSGEHSDDSNTARKEYPTSPQVGQFSPPTMNASDRSPDDTTPKTYDNESDQSLTHAIQETQNMSESLPSSSLLSTKHYSSVPNNRLSEETSVSSMSSPHISKQTFNNSPRRLNVSGGRSNIDEANSIMGREDRFGEELTYKQTIRGSQELDDLSSCPSDDMAAASAQGREELASATEQPETAGQASRAPEERKDGQTMEAGDSMEEYFNTQGN